MLLFQLSFSREQSCLLDNLAPQLARSPIIIGGVFVVILLESL